MTIEAQPYIPPEEPEPETTTTENPDDSVTETAVAPDGSAVSAEAAPSQAAVDEAAVSGEP